MSWRWEELYRHIGRMLGNKLPPPDEIFGAVDQTSTETRQAGRQAHTPERHLEDRRPNEKRGNLGNKARKGEQKEKQEIKQIKFALPDNTFGAAGQRGREADKQGEANSWSRQYFKTGRDPVRIRMTKNIWGWNLELSNRNSATLPWKSATLELLQLEPSSPRTLRILGPLETLEPTLFSWNFWGTLKLRNLHVNLQL